MTTHTSTPAPRPRPRSAGRVATTLTLLAVAAGAVSVSTAASPAQAATPTRISAYFMTPAATPAANVALLREMKADAITFGYRVLKASKSDYPAAVQTAIGTRAVFSYSGGGEWATAALRSTDRVINIDGTTWTVMDTRNNSVVVSKSTPGSDRLKALNTAGNQLSAKTIVGLPAPKAGSQDGVAYLPDTSYLPTLAEFTKRFVADATAEGADGFYQHVEMPVTDTTAWAGVRNLYATQNTVVNAAAPGAMVIISPFLESRTAKASFTPAQAARGARMLLNTANGTRLIIAPQDGLGVGSTALYVDGTSGRVASLEKYLAAMRDEIGAALWTNIELMKPAADGTRVVTTQSRVSQQLWTEAPYVRGSIAFMWDDSSRDIGAKYIPGGITNFSLGFGQTGR